MIYVCEICGKEFEASKAALTCSGKCRTRLSRANKKKHQGVTPVTTQTVTGGNDDIKRQNELLELILRELQAINRAGIVTHQTTPRFELSDSPLTEITVTAAKDNGTSGQNFLNSLMKLQQ